MSGPHTEDPVPGKPVPLSWPEARRLARLYREAYGVVPDYLAGYVETGDERWLDVRPHDPGE